MVGAAGFEVCPDMLKTTIVLMAVNDSSIRTFFFINYSVFCSRSFAANLTAKVFAQPSCWLHGLVHRQRDSGVATQGFGIRAGFVGRVHDALSLGAVGS